MAHFVQKDVLLVCSCGSLRPRTQLYICRHCAMLRCGYCICHEVDTIYCSNCLENLASSEAKIRKNRCNNCFSCPCCFHILTFRLSTVSRINPPSSEGSPAPTKTSVKSYYLFCFFCRWSTRDAKIPDEPSSTVSRYWPERKSDHLPRINNLIEYYRMITLREKLEKENTLFLHSSRGTYQHFSEKFGLTAMMARKRAGLPPLNLGRDYNTAPTQIEPAVASEEVEPLSEDVFTKPVDLVHVTSLAQRFANPDFQPELINDLFPIHKHLSVKRFLRCKSCLHNILKPEYGPASIKFKIHMAAYFSVPEVRLMQKMTLKKGEAAELILKIINPAEFSTNIQFLQITDVATAPVKPVVQAEQIVNESTEVKDVTGLIPIQKKEYPLEKPKVVQVNTNCSIDLQDAIITLAPRDDTAEFDDVRDSNQDQDNPAIVIWRKRNKVQVKFNVIPDEGLKSGDEVKVGFGMRFTFRDKIISPLEPKESKDVEVDVKHYLNIGCVE